MTRPQYREIAAHTALNRVQGMPFRWSLNPYRGCSHDCQYCFARPTHRYFDLVSGHDFSRIIFVKINLPEVLAGELGRRSWRREVVAVGTATDPYQPAEGRYRLTRRCLEVAARFRTPVSLVTKGTMILRDLDLLTELTERAGATVCFSIPTVDREIWRRTEPETPPPEQRLRVLQRLAGAGIRAGVLMAPLLPGLSADRHQIERTIRAAADHGACFIGSGLLNLGPEVREYYFAFLEAHYPDLLAGYRRLYGGKYAPKAYQARVEERIREAKTAAGYGDEHHRVIQAPARPQQLTLPFPISPLTPR